MKRITDMANSSLSCLLRNHFLKQILPHWLHCNWGIHFFKKYYLFCHSLCKSVIWLYPWKAPTSLAFKNPNGPASSDHLQNYKGIPPPNPARAGSRMKTTRPRSSDLIMSGFPFQWINTRRGSGGAGLRIKTNSTCSWCMQWVRS